MKKIIPIFLFCAFSVCASDVTLEWTASPSSNVTNYVVYFGTNGVGNYSVKVNAGTNCQVTLSNMQPAEYHAAATAQNTYGVESPFSNTATFPAPPTQIIRVGVANTVVSLGVMANPCTAGPKAIGAYTFEVDMT